MTEEKKKKKNKDVYTALVAPSRPKSESVTDQSTNGRTDGRTDTRSYRVAASRLKRIGPLEELPKGQYLAQTYYGEVARNDFESYYSPFGGHRSKKCLLCILNNFPIVYLYQIWPVWWLLW